MNCIFWNLNKKNNNELICKAIEENNCDMVLLAENSGAIEDLCANLNDFVPLISYGGCSRIKGIIKMEYSQSLLQEDDKYIIFKLTKANRSLLICGVHNLSQLRSQEEDQGAILRTMMYDVRVQEESTSIEDIIIVGDFNINPFEKNCVNADLLHALPYKEQVLKKSRICSGKTYKMLYNPMWKLFTGENAPFGTYYYDNSGKINNYFWNIFDQVLVSPSLIKYFADDNLRIIPQIKEIDLLKSNKPNVDISDHLPIFFNIKEEFYA